MPNQVLKSHIILNYLQLHEEDASYWFSIACIMFLLEPFAFEPFVFLGAEQEINPINPLP